MQPRDSTWGLAVSHLGASFRDQVTAEEEGGQQGRREGVCSSPNKNPRTQDTQLSRGPPATGLSGPLWGAETSISSQALCSQMRKVGLKGETGLPKSHGKLASDLWLEAGSQPYTFLSPLLAQSLPPAPPRQAEGLHPSLRKDCRPHPPPLVPFSHCRSHVQGSSSGPPGALGAGASLMLDLGTQAGYPAPGLGPSTRSGTQAATTANPGTGAGRNPGPAGFRGRISHPNREACT